MSIHVQSDKRVFHADRRRDCWENKPTLDLGLDIVDRVRGLDLKGNGLTREGLDENLHVEGLK